MTSPDIITLKLSAAKEFVLACMRAHLPVMIWGDPGIGKTWLVGQIAAELYGGRSKEDKEARKGIDASYFRKFILSQREPSDALGLPVPDMTTGVTRWFRPDIFPTEGAGVFFMDEFPQAVPMLQAPARQLLTERRFGPHVMPDGWDIIAAGNYVHNRAGAHALLTHVKSAVVHVNVVPDLEDLLKFALEEDWRPEVTSFLRWKGPDMVHNFNPDSQTFPCPRTWNMVSRLMDADPDPSIEMALYSGAVDKGAAGEFMAFMKFYRDLPDIDECIANPEKARVPRADATATMHALCGALSKRANDKNFGRVLKYIARMPAEFQVYGVRDAIRREPKLAENVEYGKWVVKNQALIQ